MSKDDPSNLSRAKRPLALIAGPTASGKSALGVALAKRLEAEGREGVVINADSAQVYADLAIVSARPNAAEMQGVPHVLFGDLEADDPGSAPAWAARAKSQIAACHHRGAVPILVGGTGMYLKVLLEGIAPVPPIDPGVREDVRALPTRDAYAALQSEDAERAAQLAPGDSQRIARALEVKRATGKSLAEWHRAKTGGIANDVALHPLILLPPRDWLYARCDARFVQMVETGAIEEVQKLLARSPAPSPDLPIMRAIGVREIAQYLQGGLDYGAMLEAGQQATRNFAKRQFTWFRRQMPAHWPRINAPIEQYSVDLNRYFASLLLN